MRVHSFVVRARGTKGLLGGFLYPNFTHCLRYLHHDVPPSIHASIAALAVYVVAVSAVPSLTLKTSTPNVNVDGLTNLKVSATIVNTGDETPKLLNDSCGVLDPLPENSTTTDATGSRPSLGGVMVSHTFGCMIELLPRADTFGSWS